MSIAVMVERGGKVLSRYGQAMTMNDVMAYLRGWVAPCASTERIVVTIEPPGQEAKRYGIRLNGRYLTLEPK
jgi:hypothetical protein